MTPWIAQLTDSSEIQLHARICKAVSGLPDLDYGTWIDGERIKLSCHILARAVGQIFDLAVCDGHFGRRFEHSWNILPSRHIIDVYPVGIIGGPLLVHYTMHAGFREMYTEDASISEHGNYNFDCEQFTLAVVIAERALRAAMK